MWTTFLYNLLLHCKLHPDVACIIPVTLARKFHVAEVKHILLLRFATWKISRAHRRSPICLIRCFSVKYYRIFLLVVLQFDEPTRQVKIQTTSKNIGRHFTPKHLIRDLLSNLTFFVEKILAVIHATYTVAKRKPEKIRLTGTRTLTSAIPVQRSNQLS